MKLSILFLLTFFLISFDILPARADNLTTQKIGGFTYTNGTVNDQLYNTTTQKIGGFEYTNGDLGGLGLGN